ncbi:DUF302 domain-containing protein [Salinisphaera aquimarina]|uniref:DUF302 domain-containing protein n=1 Tax=Salinisphaera aquimarina TaxID=2094031 RepID=A0ABV7EMC5_9GAMM
MTCQPRTRRDRIALWLLLALSLVVVAACDWSSELGIGNDDDDSKDVTAPVEDTDIAGLSVAVSSSDFDTTLSTLRQDVASVYRADYAQLIDHRNNADSGNLTLRPTTVVYFDDPNRSAALIAADARVALDLPARILVYRDSDNAVGVAYTNVDYLDARYALDDAENDTLDGLEDDMRTLAESAAGDDIRREGSAAKVSDGEGIETVDSDNDFNTTVNNLATAINARDNLGAPVIIDEATRAVQVGRAINPSTLFLFGNPTVGTRLMQSSQTAGVDLPQKMLVSQDDDGDVHIYYNDPGYIADRHNIGDRDDEIEAIADLLDDLADEASGSGTNRGTGAGTVTTPGTGGTSPTSPGIGSGSNVSSGIGTP